MAPNTNSISKGATQSGGGISAAAIGAGASTLGSLDLTLFCGSLAITVFIGLYFANKNKTFADYARGGGNQNIWAVSASMAAGYCSALTLIGNPSELYMHGTSFTLKMLTAVIGWPVSSFVLLPVFKQLDGISIFQYVELRFHPLLRRFISLLFIVQMLFYSAITLYLPSLPLNAALGIPQTISIGLVGIICIVYSSFGGIKAVTWTNLYHTLLVVFAMLAILITGTIQCGGLANLLSVSYAGGRWSLGEDYWKLNLSTRHTIYNSLLGYTLVRLFLHGTSQMQVQSALSLSTIRKSQASQLISAIIYFLTQVLASAIGLVLYVSYRDCDPFASGEIKRQDELLVHYISTRLSLAGVPAIQGLFLAAIFGSTLTAMSSFQSSTSAMVVEDFVKPLWLRIKRLPLSEEQSASVGKLLALILGTSCIVLTFKMDKISGLQQASTTLYGVVGAPILATFLLGALVKRINACGMFTGLVASILFGCWVFMCQVFRSHPLEPSLVVSTAGCAIIRNTTTSLLVPLINGGSGEKTNLTVLTDGELDDLLEIVANDKMPDFLNELSQENMHTSLLAQLSEMSYLWLPLFTFCITVIVAYLISILTTSADSKRHVDKSLLAPIIVKNMNAYVNEQQRQASENGKKIANIAHKLGGSLA